MSFCPDRKCQTKYAKFRIKNAFFRTGNAFCRIKLLLQVKNNKRKTCIMPVKGHWPRAFMHCASRQPLLGPLMNNAYRQLLCKSSGKVRQNANEYDIYIYGQKHSVSRYKKRHFSNFRFV
jgi:hypothetical protein